MKLGISIAASLTTLSVSLLTYYIWPHTPVPETVGQLIYEANVIKEREAFRVMLMARERQLAVPIPVLNVQPHKIVDSWGAARSGGRTHEGTDIFAPRGTMVLSATDGIVRRIGRNELGGNVVWILGPGGERYYYAHLDSFNPDLNEGDIVKPGTFLGRVGTTGNAQDTPPHLHFGIYGSGGATNPYERLVENE